MVAHLSSAGPCVEIISCLDEAERSIEETKQALHGQQQHIDDVQRHIAELSAQVQTQPIKILEQLRGTFAEAVSESNTSPSKTTAIMMQVQQHDVIMQELSSRVDELSTNHKP